MKFRIEGKKNSLALAGGLIIAAGIVVLLCTWFVGYLNQVMINETNRYLSEISSHIAARIDERMKSTFQSLEDIAETYPLLGKGATSDFLSKKLDKRSYIWLTVLDNTGKGVSSDGDTVDLSELDAVQAALEGKNAVTDLIFSPIDDTEGILYVVPVKQDGKITGAVAGWNTKDQLRDILDVTSFSSEGFSHIIQKNGDFIVKSQNKNSANSSLNFFEKIEINGSVSPGYSLEEMKADLTAGKRGILYFALNDGMEKALNYTPLDENEWYLLSVVPVKVAGQRFETVIKLAILINTVIVLLFAALIVLVVQMNRKNSRRLYHIAFTDPVTGGPSRTKFELDAEKALQKSSPNTYTLVSLDIRRFKLINDGFGSNMGDATLKHVFQSIRQHLGEGEYVCRISADHFNLLIHTLPYDELLRKLDDIAEDINHFNRQLEQKYFLPISAGVYQIDEPSLSLIQIQDRANIARKSNSQNISQLCTCTFYSDLQRMKMIREKEIEDRMASALEHREFVVYLQPKAALDTMEVAGAEALVRWSDPDKGLIPPDEFIPFFERNGFIIKLDLYVFEEVCRILRQWMDNGIHAIPISVNLSRAHLYDSTFLCQYDAIRQKYGIPPELLEIELTETLIFENPKVLIRVIEQIHALGLKCSLDDFGSGYSSLNVLKDVKVDILKLDKAFFQSPDESDFREKHVIQSVVELAKKLNMTTVAEGVETAPQMEFLKEIHCDLLQGYVFSKPIPIDEFEQKAFGKTIHII